MKFLEANKIVKNLQGGEELSFLFALSGTVEPLMIYLQAHAAQLGHSAVIETLSFNTLQQHLYSKSSIERRVYLILPWDLVPELDWRTGFPQSSLSIDQIKLTIPSELSRTNNNKKVIYLPAPFAPICSYQQDNLTLAAELKAKMVDIGAIILPEEAFSLRQYLANGCPVSNDQLSPVAERVIQAVSRTAFEPKKLLCTDFDGVLWDGIIGDDGFENVHYQSEGRGFPHFLYQSLLKQLKYEGVLIAGITRNNSTVVEEPLNSGKMIMVDEDFVAVIASFNAKSTQIDVLAEKLNLGLDSIIYVDDNPVEIEEVSCQLPAVECILFPGNVDQFPTFVDELRAYFSKRNFTPEDSERTSMYRRRAASIVPGETKGADLHKFLKSLNMKLSIHDRSTGDRERCVQLINKTNQFNLNGVRINDDEVSDVLAEGGYLFGARLEDRTGDHGEILSCLIDSQGIIQSLVMSCRVFQRRVEHALLNWLAGQVDINISGLSFRATERNQPSCNFFILEGFTKVGENLVLFDADVFRKAHQEDLQLVEVIFNS
jgi:FkbH-like protein